MSNKYICKSLGHKNAYCCYMVNPNLCKGCPYFNEMWKRKIKQSQFTYCIIYEEKLMKDCPRTWFNKEKAIYECEYQKDDYGNLNKYYKCPYKTVRKEFVK